jgi:hypothetical protein
MRAGKKKMKMKNLNKSNKIIYLGVYPKNKEFFIKLKKFCKEIIKICKKEGVNPVVWGGLAYFGYTKNKNMIFKDIDLLIPDKKIEKIIKVLSNKGIKYKYINDWHSLVISKEKLRLEIDPFEWYCRDKKLKKFNFSGLILDVVSLDSLIKIYEKASKVSKDKPKQHLERFIELKKLR